MDELNCPKTKCPKCGYERWISATFFYGDFDGNKEFFRRNCGNCGFTWNEVLKP